MLLRGTQYYGLMVLFLTHILVRDEEASVLMRQILPSKEHGDFHKAASLPPKDQIYVLCV